jgi:integrase
MPRREKGARLIERRRKGRSSVWVIKDTGRFERSTGTGCREEAEKALAIHIATKARPSGPSAAEEFLIGHALSIYAEEYAHTTSDPDRIAYAIEALAPFWADLAVSKITGPTCRRYASESPKAPGTIRRELSTLRAAINYCAAEGYLIGTPVITLPTAPEPRERYLTRQQAAVLLSAARRLNYDGRQQMRRFLILSLYTGTRKTASLAMGLNQTRVDAGWIDTKEGLVYRMGTQERATNKRRRPARCPKRLLAHARRWSRLGAKWACENHEGNRIRNNRKAWDQLVKIAHQIASTRNIPMPDRKDLTPHILKHTAITWAMQNGATIEDAASFFSTSTSTIEKVYWHHSPFCQEMAVDALDRPIKSTANRLKSGPKRGR